MKCFTRSFFTSFLAVLLLVGGLAVSPNRALAQGEDAPISRIDLDLDNLNYATASTYTREGNPVFIYATNITEHGQRAWEIIEVNKSLEVVHRTTVMCMKDKDAFAFPLEAHETPLVTFVVTKPKTGSDDGTYFVTYDPQTGRAKSAPFNESPFARIKRFARVGSDIFVVGHDRREQPLALVVDANTNRTNMVNVGQGYEAGTISEVLYNSATKEIIFTLWEYIDKKNKDVRLVVIDRGFNPVANTQMNVLKHEGKIFPDLRMTIMNGKMLVYGSYGFVGKGVKAKDFVRGSYTAASAGLFLGELTNKYEVNNMKFYNFSAYKSLPNVLKEKQMRRIDKLVTKAEDKGKEPNVNWLIYMHPMQQREGNYILHVEIAEAIYHTERTGFGRNATTVQVFDGYNNPYFLTLALDKEGNKVWEIGQKMDFFTTYTLRPHSTLISDADEFKIWYKADKEYRSLDLLDPEKKVSVRPKPTAPTKEPLKVDVIKTYATQSKDWYDNFELRFGYQKIRALREGYTKKDVVFFIEKL